MGILNITPDSFSDGGDFFNVENALLQTQKIVQSGVDILDIGAQSTKIKNNHTRLNKLMSL